MGQENEERRANRLKVYESYVLSGLGVTAYGRAHGISPWKLRVIIDRSERESSSSHVFREVKLPKASRAEYGVVLHNGRELRIPSGFVVEEVRKLVEIVERC